MKSIIKLISQILTLILIGYLLASLRQKNKLYYYIISTAIVAFLGLAGGAIFSAVLEDSLAMAITSELRRYWYWYLISFVGSYYLFEKIVESIQVVIFEGQASLSATLIQRIAGGILSIVIISVSLSVHSALGFLLIIAVMFVGIYIALKNNGGDSTYQKELSALMLDKMENFASSTIHERQVYLEQRIYSDPDFRQFAKKYNMTEDEFVSKVARYNSKNPGAYAKLLRYDVKKSKFKDFI